MKKLYILLFCLLIGFPSLAGWEVVEEVDSMTDEMKKFVVVRNDDGHAFILYLGSEKLSIWANFSLSDKSLNQIDSERLIMVRIDKNKPLDVYETKKIGKTFLKALLMIENYYKEDYGSKDFSKNYEWNPKWVNFVIEREDVERIIQGKKLLVRYYLPVGGYKETSFMIEGGEDAIRQVIDIGV